MTPSPLSDGPEHGDAFVSLGVSVVRLYATMQVASRTIVGAASV
jgi:hypothetical protein